ncbi:MAG: hypothetical protein LBI17_02550 [Rickettsiales bacterium]|jgi:acyl carrier protein|nr:hypothetical protein [Rickettsiales bacterium]
MNKHTITFSDYKKMKEIISLVVERSIPPSMIIPKAHIGFDLGCDSMDEFGLVYAFEKEFGISIPDDAVWKPEGPKTVKNVMLLVGKYLKEARTARQ